MTHFSFYADEIGTISFPYLSLILGGNTDYDNNNDNDNEESEDEDDFDNEDADMTEEVSGMSDKTEINPFKTNFSLTFSRKTEYIFLSYVSIEELFRK